LFVVDALGQNPGAFFDKLKQLPEKSQKWGLTIGRKSAILLKLSRGSTGS